jgi:hypothetical protein
MARDSERPLNELRIEHRAGGTIARSVPCFYPDACGFVDEKEAANYLRMSQKSVARMRDEGYWEYGKEVRRIRQKWRYSLQALDRYHEEQGAPERW